MHLLCSKQLVELWKYQTATFCFWRLSISSHPCLFLSHPLPPTNVLFLGTMVNPGGSSQPPPVGTGSLSWKRCAGCGGKIADRFLLYTMDSYWHSRCLKCSCCQAQLGEIGTSCYTKSGMILCRNDYIRWEWKHALFRKALSFIAVTRDVMVQQKLENWLDILHYFLKNCTSQKAFRFTLKKKILEYMK